MSSIACAVHVPPSMQVSWVDVPGNERVLTTRMD
jgi:hypothetical protein